MRIPPFAVSSVALVALAAAFTMARPGVGTAHARGEAQPVVVELFTSEGCSSCPPADVLLDRLSRDQPVPGAEVIALELHVDYWDHLGWTDPFSRAQHTARQRAYADSFGQRGAYTPQMVIDGQQEVVGSNDRNARDAIGVASRLPKAKVKVTRNGDKLNIAIDALPDANATEPAQVWLAVTEDGLSTRVPRGENSGATLVHGPVVRELRKLVSIAATARGPVTVKDVEVTMDAAWKRENVRAVAFVQREKTLQIVGAGAASMR
jgi:hypothetical protein